METSDKQRFKMRGDLFRALYGLWSKYSNVAFSKAFHPALALSQWCEQSTIFMGAARDLPLEMLGWRGRLQGFR